MAKKSRPKAAAKPKGTAKRALKRRPIPLALTAWKPTVEPPAPVRRLKKSPLSKAELREFRQMLLAKRQALLGDMTGMAAEALGTNRQEGSGDLSKIPTHDADVGTDNFEQEFTLGLLESERTLLSEIDEALERIKKGIYGICLGTGQAIGKPRLRARPWARYCIEYAKMVEKGLAPRTGERRGTEAADFGEKEADEEEAEVEAPPEAEESPED